jgi:acyl dehydratase
MTATRRLEISDELIRTYSRRGNFHSEAAEADALGLPGLVAQGTQVCGPAYGVFLDAWSEDFLAHGELDVRFVAMVVGGQTVEARVEVAADDTVESTFVVENLSSGRTAAIGSARR